MTARRALAGLALFVLVAAFMRPRTAAGWVRAVGWRTWR